MTPAELDYWVTLSTGVPMMLLWFGVIVALAAVTIRRTGAYRHRRLAVAAVVTSGAVAGGYSALAIWHPLWYRHWMGNLVTTLTAICFLVSLNCAISSTNSHRSPTEQRRAEAFSLFLGILIVSFLTIALMVPGWSGNALLVPFGILVALACVVHHRTQRPSCPA